MIRNPKNSPTRTEQLISPISSNMYGHKLWKSEQVTHLSSSFFSPQDPNVTISSQNDYKIIPHLATPHACILDLFFAQLCGVLCPSLGSFSSTDECASVCVWFFCGVRVGGGILCNADWHSWDFDDGKGGCKRRGREDRRPERRGGRRKTYHVILRNVFCRIWKRVESVFKN